ncbi:MAG: type II toxin-antitoxin system VapC family toxin [Gemmatimonadota bacterium]|nr:type II toxin-antitoxin system VapC family toxin [Gemmatimonadota bacterium]
MRALLDSNAYSQLMLGREQVRRIVRGAEEVLLSAVVLGELLYGFRHGSRYERNIRGMRAFLDNPYVSLVPVGETTADRYSRIAASLRAKGRPIPTNDVWLAAHAMETGADLVSADRHFEHVDGIAWVRLTTEASATALDDDPEA